MGIDVIIDVIFPRPPRSEYGLYGSCTTFTTQPAINIIIFL